MMTRKTYEAPVSEMLVMGAEDVVTTSGSKDVVSKDSLYGPVDTTFNDMHIYPYPPFIK